MFVFAFDMHCVVSVLLPPVWNLLVRQTFGMRAGIIMFCLVVEDSEREEMLVTPPGILEDSATSESIWACLQQRLPLSWMELAPKAKFSAVVFSHDSHKANIKCCLYAVRRRPSNCLVFSLRCSMHQVQIVVKRHYLLSFFSFHNPLFCLSNLLRISRHNNSLRDNMKAAVFESLVLDYNRPDPRHREYASALLRMTYLEYHVDEADNIGGDGNMQTKTLECEKLLAVLNGDWTSTRIVHHCSRECGCRSELEAKRKVWAAIEALAFPFF